MLAERLIKFGSIMCNPYCADDRFVHVIVDRVVSAKSDPQHLVTRSVSAPNPRGEICGSYT